MRGGGRGAVEKGIKGINGYGKNKIKFKKNKRGVKKHVEFVISGT